MNDLLSALGARAGLLPALAGAMLLASCTTDVPSGLPGHRPAPMPMAQQALPPAQGEVIGSGETRVALLLPLTAEGNGARVAAELRNAAIMASEDTGANAVHIVVKDTGGTEAGASAAAAGAAAERAALVLGPLFAPNVRAASSVLAPQGLTTVAFSSDRAVAAPNVYLNSYMPEGLVERVLSHAASQGLTKIVAIVPNGPAGDLAEAQARRTLQMTGGSLTALARYDYDNASVQAAVQEVAMAAAEADAIFLPDGGNSPSAIVSALRGLGVDLAGKRLLGTGQWASVDLSDAALEGAWFADTDRALMEAYKSRYLQRFGAEPSVTSALAYDSVILAATLARRGGADAFTPANLQIGGGFAGYTGTFRFRADGTAERGYAIYEVAGGMARLISPAPKSFAGS